MKLSFKRPPSTLRYEDDDRRLILKLADVSDAPALVEAIQESLPALRQFMPWAHYPQSVEEQERRLTELVSGFGAGGDLVFHIYERDGGPFMGCVGLHRGRTLNSRAFEIGYWVRTGASGRGLATLAAQCVVVLGMEYFQMERIQCCYNEANRGSKRVQEKVGFVEEGRLRHYVSSPTDEMRARGAVAGPFTVVNGLFPEDRPRLEWYAKVFRFLTVLDREGRTVYP